MKSFRLFVWIGLLGIVPFMGMGQQSLERSIVHDGLTRTYRIYIPAAYTGETEVPLLFNLHGYTSNAQQQELYGDFRPIADTANFILVHPNGTLDASNNMHWDAFSVSGVDDVGFISRLIDTLSANYAINRNNVYSVGMSNGGYMSYKLACSLGDKVTAVGSVTGSMPINLPNTCSPTKPTPVIQIHGTNDLTVPYNGNATSLGIPALVDFWVAQNNCDETPIFTELPDLDPTDLSTVEHYLYTNGDQQSEVSLFKVINGGHTWPGASVSIGVTNRDINASVEIWKFFQKYSTDQLLSTTAPEELPLTSIYPNPSNGHFTIRASEHVQKIECFDVKGRHIKTVVPSHKATEQTLTIEEKGMFFVQVHTAKGVVRQKIVVN